MRLPSLNNVFAVTSSIAAGCVVATAIADPSRTATAFGAFGGASAGALLGIGYTRKQEQDKAEGLALAQSFKHLYDSNRGLISPDQLSYHAGIARPRIDDFLANLAAEQQGQRVETQYGVVYSFPHPDNVLNQLTENAQNWVKAKETPLLQEIQVLQQTIAQLTRPPVPVPQQAPSFSRELEEIQKLAAPEIDPLPGMNADPWNKL